MKKLFRNRKGVSHVLAAIIMIILFTTAIGVVWGWLFPAYQRFQTSNTINSVTTYFLRVDAEVYNLLSEGPGSTKVVNFDPHYGTFWHDDGKNVTLVFHDANGTFNESYSYNNLGGMEYIISNRKGVLIRIGEYEYLKGPNDQQVFFVNGSIESNVYQGLTNLTLMRPQDNEMRIYLDYRVNVYTWFDTTNNILSVTINMVQFSENVSDFNFISYSLLKINYNQTNTVYSNSAVVDTDFYIDGSIFSSFNPFERALTFVKPGTVGSYTVNIEVITSQMVLFV